jgi:hypothetical protein
MIRVCINQSLLTLSVPSDNVGESLRYIDWGEDEPGMTLQCRDGKWVNYKVDGEVVKSPVDIDALPPGRYRLV